MGQNGDQDGLCRVHSSKPVLRPDGSSMGETAVEMERSDRFKDYIKGQTAEPGDGLDMGMMNGFWFLACVSEWTESPVPETGELRESPGNTERARAPCWAHTAGLALGHTRGHGQCLKEATHLKAASCKTHSGNVRYHDCLQYCIRTSNPRACFLFMVFLCRAILLLTFLRSDTISCDQAEG